MAVLSVIGEELAGEPEELIERFCQPARIVSVKPTERGARLWSAGRYVEKACFLYGFWARRRFVVRMIGCNRVVDAEADAELARPWYARTGGLPEPRGSKYALPASMVRLPGWPNLDPGPVLYASVVVYGMSARQGGLEAVHASTEKGFSIDWAPAELTPELITAVAAARLGGLEWVPPPPYY